MYQAASYPHPHGVYLRELLHCCAQRSDRVPLICLLLKLNMDNVKFAKLIQYIQIIATKIFIKQLLLSVLKQNTFQGY